MNLQSLIDSASSGDIVRLGSGEFFGQVAIDRPLTIIGRGKSTWIGSGNSPTIKITVPGVELRDLMVEAASGKEKVAIEADPGTDPILINVSLGETAPDSPHGTVDGAAQ